jgi:hypothetical protein
MFDRIGIGYGTHMSTPLFKMVRLLCDKSGIPRNVLIEKKISLREKEYTLSGPVSERNWGGGGGGVKLLHAQWTVYNS